MAGLWRNRSGYPGGGWVTNRIRSVPKYRPGRPQGRGKIERFFRSVDQSLVPEAQALVATGRLTSLAELNEFFWAWLEVASNSPAAPPAPLP